MVVGKDVSFGVFAGAYKKKIQYLEKIKIVFIFVNVLWVIVIVLVFFTINSCIWSVSFHSSKFTLIELK